VKVRGVTLTLVAGLGLGAAVGLGLLQRPRLTERTLAAGMCRKRRRKRRRNRHWNKREENAQMETKAANKFTGKCLWKL